VQSVCLWVTNFALKKHVLDRETQAVWDIRRYYWISPNYKFEGWESEVDSLENLAKILENVSKLKTIINQYAHQCSPLPGSLSETATIL
jgi:hypothetical protein